LKKKASKRKRAEHALGECEQRYRALFEQAADSIVLIDGETGEFVEFNERALDSLGFSREEFKKLKIPDFEVVESAEQVAKHIKKIIKKGSDSFETKHRTKTGEIRDIQVRSTAISIRGKNFVQSIWRDITDGKRAQDALRKAHEQLEKRVEKRTAELSKVHEQLKQEIAEHKRAQEALQEREAALEARTRELEEVNNALSVLLKRIEEDKKELEEKMLLNVKQLVLPYVEKMKKYGLSAKQMAYFRIFESNLKEIISPFAHELSSKHFSLSPTEIQVAHLVKDGSTTKEIAELLNLCSTTVEAHRKKIRKKVGIKNKKANLRSYLLSV